MTRHAVRGVPDRPLPIEKSEPGVVNVLTSIDG